MPDDQDFDDNDDTHARCHDGIYQHGDQIEPGRLYHGANEPCPEMPGVQLDATFERWVDPDGVKAFRRVEANGASVGGGSRKYSANYDTMDWGN